MKTIKVNNIEDLKTCSISRTVRVVIEGSRYGITWSPDRNEWWLILESSEINHWLPNLPVWLQDELDINGLTLSIQ